MKRLRGFIGTHGSDDVTIILWAETDGIRRRLRNWTKDHGEVLHTRAATRPTGPAATHPSVKPYSGAWVLVSTSGAHPFHTVFGTTALAA
ncbi:hypothetical protein OG429_38630 [Streptomyces sp. NBC_00190]|uniref:hypothetical protein n=1 Tax=unclassified Streptomyces TaxID=2593676 RepID=UPI002E2E79A7|nr:hypothetical protein [Streptomyces sp. NBC_00190]WSZ44658.1 hypothetical protein OG239_41060 [Streptomyces sp. NBC_00868]